MTRDQVPLTSQTHLRLQNMRLSSWLKIHPERTIYYAAGTYHTTGNLQMANGVTHQGAGIDSTIIKLANGTGSVLSMFWGNCILRTITAFTASDMTIDCNANHQSWWNPSSGTGRLNVFSFPDAASYCTVQRVKFINFGVQNGESFLIFFGDGCGNGTGTVNHNTINGCIFTQPIATGNTNGGVTCIGIINSGAGVQVDATNMVENCQFINMGHSAGYTDMGFTQCVTVPVIKNCTAISVDDLWYVEPGDYGGQTCFPGITVQITGNTLVNCRQIASIKFAGNGSMTGALNIQNNTDTMSTGYPVAVEIRNDSYSGTVTCGNVTVRNNTFTYTGGSIPVAILTKCISPDWLTISSLSIISNTFVHFPAADSAINQTAIQYTPGYILNYTESANVFLP